MKQAMCHDCPHRREHEVGDEVQSFVGEEDGPHPCHIRKVLPCVGHVLSLKNRGEGKPFFLAMAGDVVQGPYVTVYTRYGPEGIAQEER